MPQKEILNWKSKVQYKKGIPFLYLIKHLSNKYSLRKGNEIDCKLMVIDEKLKIVIDID